MGRDSLLNFDDAAILMQHTIVKIYSNTGCFCLAILQLSKATVVSYLWVFIGGGIGSVLRFGISTLSPRWFSEEWASLIATFGSNILACVLLVLVVKWQAESALSKSTYFLLATGVCGGFSTFSTFSLETFTLWSRGDYLWSILYVLLSVSIGFAIMWIALKNVPSA